MPRTGKVTSRPRRSKSKKNPGVIHHISRYDFVAGYAYSFCSDGICLSGDTLEQFFAKCGFDYAIYTQKNQCGNDMTRILCVPVADAYVKPEDIVGFFGKNVAVTVYPTFVTTAVAIARYFKEASCFLTFTDQKTQIVRRLIDDCDRALLGAITICARKSLTYLRKELMKVYDQNSALPDMVVKTPSRAVDEAVARPKYSWHYYKTHAERPPQLWAE